MVLIVVLNAWPAGPQTMLGIVSNLAVIQRFRDSLGSQPQAEYSFFSHISAGELESIDIRQLGVLAAAIVTVATSQGINRGWTE